MFKKNLVLVLVVLLTLSVAVGSVCAEGSPYVGDEEETYYMVTHDSGVDYWSTVYAGFKQAAKDLGVKVVYTGTSEHNISKEVTVFNQVVAKKPAGIALAAITPDAFIEPINGAIESGVPVVCFASDSPRSKEISYITSDNVQEGQAAADYLAEAIGGEGEVAVTTNPGQNNHELRIKSFIERIETKWPDIKVVAQYATNQDTSKAYTGLQQMVQAHPDLKAVFSPEASSGMGAAQAANDLGTGIKAMCVDLNTSILDMIKAGKMFAAIQPDTVTQGYLSMLSLYLANHNLIDPMNDWEVNPDKGPIDIPFVDNGLDIVTKENAEYFYSDQYLEEHDMKSW